MVVQNISALTQFTNENGENWIESDILPENLIVYDDINQIFKKGNGQDLYDDLPIWLDMNVIKNIYDKCSVVIDFDIFSGENIDKLVMISKDKKITVSDLTLTELENIYNLINDIGENNYDETIRISNIIKIVFFNYSDKVTIGSTINLSMDSINVCDVTDNDLEYRWYIDDQLYENNSKSISYDILNDSSLIGQILNFKLVVYCKMLNISSMIKEVDIEIIDNNYLTKPVILDSALTAVF